MKLLVLYQARDTVKDQPGYHDGFERLVAEGTLTAHAALPYYGVAEARDWTTVWSEAYETARRMAADAIFLQFFHGHIPDPAEGITRLKNLSTHPMIFTSLGDGFGRWTHRVPKCFRIASKLSDVTFFTGMGFLARQLARAGNRNLVLMPNGCCQVRFAKSAENTHTVPEFDVAFVGNRMNPRNPFSHFGRTAKRRSEFVSALTKRYGMRLGLFGKGWNGNPAWQGPIPYEAQHQAYRRAAVALGGTPNAHHDYYTSDRVFIAVASGIPFVDHWVNGVDRILKPNRDWWLARDQKEMFRLCDKLLETPNSDRVRWGREAREQVLAHHTQYHRCGEMIEVVKALREARFSGRKAAKPRLGFLSDGFARGPVPDAIVGWEG